MALKIKSRIVVFILALLCYLALTSFTDYQELIAGIVVALIVSYIAGGIFLKKKNETNIFIRLKKTIQFIFIFFIEMAKANLNVAFQVIHPNVPVKPGIVKVKTILANDSAITILANAITLTPGTLTVDIDEENKELYVHWINVKKIDGKIETGTINKKFEQYLKEVFE